MVYASPAIKSDFGDTLLESSLANEFSGLCDAYDGKVARMKKVRTEEEKALTGPRSDPRGPARVSTAAPPATTWRSRINVSGPALVTGLLVLGA